MDVASFSDSNRPAAPNSGYRLSDTERRLIVAWNLCADISVREIAEISDTREHRVRHALEGLIRKGILVPMYLIDNYRLGFTDYGLFFAPSAEPSSMRKKFEESLETHLRVVWLARMSGSFQYGATFMARRPHEVSDFFAGIQPLSQGAYAHKTMRIGIDCTWFSPNYLAPEIKGRQVVSVTTREVTPPLTSSDEKILVTMTRNPSASIAQLSRLTGMSASSLSYRIEKLRADNIVRGRMYSIHTGLLGILMYRIMIVDCGFTDEQREQLFKICSQSPNVVALVTCTGSWDYELRFETEYPEVVDNFCQKLIDSFGRSIGSILVSQQLSTLKRLAYPQG